MYRGAAIYSDCQRSKRSRDTDSKISTGARMSPELESRAEINAMDTHTPSSGEERSYLSPVGLPKTIQAPEIASFPFYSAVI